MKSNILAFNGSPACRLAKARTATRNNVVSLRAWKKKGQPLRTSRGVFFISNVLCTPGDLA